MPSRRHIRFLVAAVFAFVSLALIYMASPAGLPDVGRETQTERWITARMLPDENGDT